MGAGGPMVEGIYQECRSWVPFLCRYILQLFCLGICFVQVDLCCLSLITLLWVVILFPLFYYILVSPLNLSDLLVLSTSLHWALRYLVQSFQTFVAPFRLFAGDVSPKVDPHMYKTCKEVNKLKFLEET